jgi:ketosteroid isomerase-like protein
VYLVGIYWGSDMIRKFQLITIFSIFLSPQVTADDAADVRATIERHYAAIHSDQIESVLNDHLEDMTMFLADGTVLWEHDWAEVSERMGATAVFGTLNVRMSNFNVQVYGNVAVATFYLVGTETRDGKVRDITNRVSATWVKSSGGWKEAHHHESPLLGRGHRR